MRACRLLATLSLLVPNSARLGRLVRRISIAGSVPLLSVLSLAQTFVQVNNNTVAANASTVNVTYATAETAGDLNVVVVGWNDTSSSVMDGR